MRLRVILPLLCAATLAFGQRTITFSNLPWTVKGSSSKVGPGPNFFSSSPSNVWVDSTGRLHLKITRSGNKWYCAEVMLQATLGYGSYRFYLDSPVDNLDPNVVLGLFTWNDDPAYNNREMDIEFARWANRANPNGWYTVQPYTAGIQASFIEPPNVPQSTHMFDWNNVAGSLSVAFQSLKGFGSVALGGNLIAAHTFNTGVPPTGGETVHMNLWLFQGTAPSDRKTVEIIVNRFEFVPQQ